MVGRPFVDVTPPAAPEWTLWERRISGLVRGSGLGWLMPSLGGRGAGPGGLDGVRAVQQWLAAQPLGDADGFADRGLGGLVLARAQQAGGVVEQPVGEVVGVECWRSPVIAAANAALASGPASPVARRARAMSRSARCIGASCPGGYPSSRASRPAMVAVSARSWAA